MGIFPYFYSTTREFGSEGLEPVSDEFEEIPILDEKEEDALYCSAVLTGYKNDNGYGYVEEIDITGGFFTYRTTL